MADLSVTNHGSIFILNAETQEGEDWIAENIPDEAMTWAGGIVVEHRYIENIVAGAQCDGLVVEG